MIRDAIAALVDGKPLSMEQAAEAMIEIMSGDATPAQFGAFVTALRLKGETPDEIAGMAQVMREKSLHVDVDGPLVDTCGTGGDASGSFNISTTAGFMVAGAGTKVAKHGNRAMSGACGSADVLEALGVKIDLSPEGVRRCLEEVGVWLHVRSKVSSVYAFRRRPAQGNRHSHRVQHPGAADQPRRGEGPPPGGRRPHPGREDGPGAGQARQHPCAGGARNGRSRRDHSGWTDAWSGR